jgi:hypothetical protein
MLTAKIKRAKKILTLDFIVFGAIFMAFVLTALILVRLYRFSLNPDGVAYLEIAKKYAHWHIAEAINGYWSPLISWLLVPFVWVGVNLQLAFRFLALLSSLLALAGVWKILTISTTKLYVKATAFFAIAVIFLSWSLAGPVTGDIFFVAAAVWLALTFDYHVKNKTWISAVLLAINGAILYFAKSIGFFVFLGMLLCIALIEFRSTRKVEIIKRYALVAILFLIIVLPFIIAISNKYNKPTVSTAGPINFLLATQYSATTDAYNHPITVGGPYAPGNNEISAWEDPTVFTSQMSATTHAIKRAQKINNYYHSLLHNINAFIEGLSAPLIIFGGIGIGLLYKKQKYLALPLIFCSFITLLGYVLTYLEPRYIYIVTITLIIGAAVLVNSQNRRIAIAGAVLLMLFLIAPIAQLVQQGHSGYGTYQNAQKVSKVIPPGANILSDDPSAIYYCYYGQFRCHTTVVSLDNIGSYAKSHNIHYFLLGNVRNILAQPNFWEVMSQQKLVVVNEEGQILK